MTGDLVGATLGGYRLDELIGEGGMAVVYKAYQVSLKRSVAVKVLYYQEDTSLIRFQREAKAIAALRHRNILIIYEYGDQNGQPFIAMEYVEGGTLEDRMYDGPMAWRKAIELIIPIAEALNYAHSQGIIHRDIKPSNILMPQDDWPVLADFGLVKRSDEEHGLTRTGTFMGTPSYIAPEQARDAKLDHRADMYSLGVVLFEMVTGVLPFDYDNPNKVLLAHVKDAPPRPRSINPDCPPALEAVILKVLSKSAEDRYPDMQALVRALQGVLVAPDVDPIGGATQNVGSPEPEQKSTLGRLFKKVFGRNSEADESSGKTSPRQQVQPKEDEELEGTITLNFDHASPTPRLIVQGKDAVIELPQKESLIIGRTHGGSTADVDLGPFEASKYGVSRQHARLLRQGDRWLVEDLNSLNGTYVNEKEVKQGQPAALEEGDVIRVSHMKLVFVLSS